MGLSDFSNVFVYYVRSCARVWNMSDIVCGILSLTLLHKVWTESLIIQFLFYLSWAVLLASDIKLMQDIGSEYGTKRSTSVFLLFSDRRGYHFHVLHHIV